MTRVNLLEQKGLHGEPVSLGRPVPGRAGAEEEVSDVTEAFTESIEQPAEIFEQETSSAEEISGLKPETSQRPIIPEGDRGVTPSMERHYKPEESAFSRGPSSRVILFLLVVAIGVTLYFILRSPDDMTPVPVTPVPEETTPVTPGEQSTETPPAKESAPESPIEQKPATQDTGESQAAGKGLEKYVPFAGMEKSESDIQLAIQHGRQKAESTRAILTATAAGGHINFLSLSNDHLTLNAFTLSPKLSDQLHNEILGTSIVDSIGLFLREPSPRGEGYNVDVYTDVIHTPLQPDSSSLRPMSLSDIFRKLKEWIALPSIRILDWRPQYVAAVDGWDRGPVYIQLAGTKVSIMRVLQIVRKEAYNVGISKVYIYNHTEQPSLQGPYQVKLYLTLYGKAE